MNEIETIVPHKKLRILLNDEKDSYISDVHQVMKFPAGATKPSLGEETISSLTSILVVKLF